MERRFTAESGPISFGVVKVILQSYGLTPEVDDPVLRQGLRIIWPLDAELAERVRSDSASLTDAATSAEQIRFFQRQRATRSYVKIAKWISSKHDHVRLEIERADLLDEPSRDFLKVASDIAGWQVRLRFAADTADGHGTGFEASPDHREDELLRQLGPAELSTHLTEVWTAAFAYVNAGDAWTAITLGQQLSAVEQSPRVWNLLALGHAMLGQTENAEFYYRRWAAGGSNEDKIKAYYGIAMLYARHHRPGLRDLDVAARFLQDAFTLITELSDADQRNPAMVFESVFNRNGYALILFRRGQVEEALSLIKAGIERLTQTSEKVAIHRSVLMYNLAQCHRQLGDIPSALRTYEELLAVDPYMPEYHLEAARTLAAAGTHVKAVAAVRNALDLDDTLAVAWALLGLYQGEIDEHEEAARSYSIATSLDPDHHSYVLDEAYYLILSGDSATALDKLEGVRPRDDSSRERRVTLVAEALNRTGRRREAVAVMDEALLLQPDSEVIRANRAILASA